MDEDPHQHCVSVADFRKAAVWLGVVSNLFGFAVGAVIVWTICVG